MNGRNHILESFLMPVTHLSRDGSVIFFTKKFQVKITNIIMLAKPMINEVEENKGEAPWSK
jgi:hypothetical protein